MKKSIIGLVAMLVCIAAMSTALASCPPGMMNCIDVYDGDSGSVIGDAESTVTSVEDVQYYTGDKVEAIASFSAKLKVPSGTQGEGYAYHAVDLHALGAPTASVGGQKYYLAADANGLIKLGVRKTSDAGEETAEAKIAAIAGANNAVTNPVTCPDCRNNLIYGSAEVSAKTKSTGTGGTYAIVEPLDNDAAYAEYYSAPLFCETCQVKETEGEVYSNIELRTCNRECIDCCETCDVGGVTPGGTKTVEAKSFTKSDANNFKSNSYSSATLTANAKRTTKGTSTAFGEITDIDIGSRSRDNTGVYGPWNAETSIVGSGYLEAEGAAYAPKDSTTASATMITEANTDNNANTNKAYAKADTLTTVYRADLNNYLRANSEAELNYISFFADARDLRSSQKYANVNGLISMESAGILLKKDIRDSVGIKSQITKELTATRSGSSAKSVITDKVTNKGPVSGNANDESVAEQLADLHASARSTTKNTYVDIVGAVTASDVFGNDAVATGTTNLPSVTTGKNLVINPFTTSATHNTWTMSFGATSS